MYSTCSPRYKLRRRKIPKEHDGHLTHIMTRYQLPLTPHDASRSRPENIYWQVTCTRLQYGPLSTHSAISSQMRPRKTTPGAQVTVPGKPETAPQHIAFAAHTDCSNMLINSNKNCVLKGRQNYHSSKHPTRKVTHSVQHVTKKYKHEASHLVARDDCRS